MKRRSILQTFATLPAAALLGGQQPVVAPKPSAAAIEEIPTIEATIPDVAGSTKPSYFSEERFAALVRFSEMIVPSMNGVPGAIETHAPEFLDFLIGESPHARQALYNDGLAELNARAKKEFNVLFARASKEQAAIIISPLQAAWKPKPDRFTDFLLTAKQDVLQATENSQEWIHVMAKRVRSAGGLGMYWFPIE